jgi:ubiquinol-cytochrome c reductase cytochrome c subunit
MSLRSRGKRGAELKYRLSALMLLVCGAAAAQNAENGKRLYLKDGCYECHGYAGQGGAGARIAPRVLAAAAFIAYVRHPAGAMPPYTSKVASDSDLNDIRAYLATMPAPPPLKSVPILNQ